MKSLRIALLSLIAAVATAAEPEQVAQGVYLIHGSFGPGGQPDGNSIVLAGTDGLIVVDTGRHTAHLQRITEFAGQRKSDIEVIINTHWHLDHIGNNGRLRALYPSVRVYASDALSGALNGFLANYKRDLEQALANSPDAAQAPAYRAELAILSRPQALAPDQVLAIDGEQTIAGRRIAIHLEHAATRGDVWLLDVNTQTLIAGDIVTLPAPFLDTACPQRWRRALARIESTPFHRLIPGHGRAITHDELSAYRKGFDNLLACAATDIAEATCMDGWIRDVRDLLSDSDREAARSMLAYYLKNNLRNAPTSTKLCAP
jgi:glyoxylase-like metal-dependent hydrolase (beta-lactamase superfamily II)